MRKHQAVRALIVALAAIVAFAGERRAWAEAAPDAAAAEALLAEAAQQIARASEALARAQEGVAAADKTLKEKGGDCDKPAADPANAKASAAKKQCDRVRLT